MHPTEEVSSLVPEQGFLEAGVLLFELAEGKR